MDEIYGKLVFDGTEVDLQKVRDAQDLLREAGVTFDSGAFVTPGENVQGIEWELDWSLEGATLLHTGSPEDESA